MSLGYVLQIAGQKMGLNPAQASQRTVLLRFANEAAKELYAQYDPPGSLLEQTFKVNGNQTISCPNYVGDIRGVREDASWLAWHINKLRPRYNQFNWKDCWRNLRLKNTQALAASVTNQSVGVFTVEVVENPPVQITVTGKTDFSTEFNEIVIMNALSVKTVNEYNDFNMLRKNTPNQYDITLSDIDGKVLAVIPNNQIESIYQIYDVSDLPWLQQTQSAQDHYLEILFKKRLPEFLNDSDQFPAQEMDFIWVCKIMQLWCEEQGKIQEALAWDAKATRTAKWRSDIRDMSTEDEVAVVANPHDNLLPRVRQGLGRHRYWRGRYF